MDKQLFYLPEIDREATRKAVEGVLETARLYKQIGFVRRDMKNTPSYAPRFHGNTYAIGKPAEDVAVWNSDNEKRIVETSERVERAVNRLSKKEKEIVIKRYLEDDEAYDYLICHELGMSERSYRRVKARAMYKLAFMLKLEVMIEPEKVNVY
ncbi:ArpU family phage packaging/lysis transcriptional regulator [Tepidibacillus marianensis]|uniref:ArpU family phage packaging/lysis transcriptional regulator n=1 Tax=Tepidibacillus marianensis TaxID=3131995 RepID=UPI0030CF6A39